MCNEYSADRELSSEQKSFSLFGALRSVPKLFQQFLSQLLSLPQFRILAMIGTLLRAGTIQIRRKTALENSKLFVTSLVKFF